MLKYFVLNVLIRNSKYSMPSEKSRLVQGFGFLNIEPVYEQPEGKLPWQKLWPEVTVIRDVQVKACNESRQQSEFRW